MLYDIQANAFIDLNAGEVPYFWGTTASPLEDGDRVLQVVGAKKLDGMIKTTVHYMHPNRDVTAGPIEEITFQEDLAPAKFERFLNDVAGTIALNVPGNKFFEIDIAVMAMPSTGLKLTEVIKRTAKFLACVPKMKPREAYALAIE